MFEHLYAELRSGRVMSFESDQGAAVGVEEFAIMEPWEPGREVKSVVAIIRRSRSDAVCFKFTKRIEENGVNMYLKACWVVNLSGALC